jgi:hypothetical protein
MMTVNGEDLEGSSCGLVSFLFVSWGGVRLIPLGMLAYCTSPRLQPLTSSMRNEWQEELKYKNKQTNSVALSPQVNYTDRATATCQ